MKLFSRDLSILKEGRGVALKGIQVGVYGKKSGELTVIVIDLLGVITRLVVHAVSYRRGYYRSRRRVDRIRKANRVSQFKAGLSEDEKSAQS